MLDFHMYKPKVRRGRGLCQVLGRVKGWIFWSYQEVLELYLKVAITYPLSMEHEQSDKAKDDISNKKKF